MLKFIGAVLIVSATTYFAMCVSLKRRARAEELALLSNLADDFLNEINYRLTPSGVLLEKYLSKKQYAALYGLNIDRLSINDDEKRETAEFLSALGHSGREMQVYNLKCFAESMKSAAKTAGEKLDMQIRITNSIGFFGGIFISLLIL